MKRFVAQYESSKTPSDLFQLVRQGVKYILGTERAGLMLGTAELGMKAGGFIGAFYPVGSNIIVINNTALKILESDRPELVKPYVFHLLLHEYLHSVGILDEKATHMITLEISKKMFGEHHIAAKMSVNFAKYFPKMAFAHEGWEPECEFKIDLVENFDEPSISYIG
jgi:hypothetical protein